MKTVETLNEGLKREYRLTITAKDIDARVDDEVKAIAPTVRMPGFRPGKVPPNLIRKMHGEALSADALNKAIDAGVRDLMTKEKLRPALQPAVSLEDGYERGKDAELTVALEVLPEIEAPSIDGLKLERLTVAADDAAVMAKIEEFAAQMKRFEDAPKTKKAATGDQVIIDFAGSVDGVAFDGGTGEDMAVEIGSGQLIPGFEDLHTHSSYRILGAALIAPVMLAAATVGIVSTGPGFTLFGLLPLGTADSGGLFGTAAEKTYILFGLLIGLAFGPVQASSRSYMARSVTAAESGRYFGIYALAGRATSFAAPFLVATVTAASGSARLGMAVIIIFLLGGLWILAGTPYPADKPAE